MYKFSVSILITSFIAALVIGGISILNIQKMPVARYDVRQPTTDDTIAADDNATSTIQKLYAASAFRIIKVVENPFVSGTTFVVAIRRDSGGEGYYCGGFYSPPCYFFLEGIGHDGRFVAADGNNVGTIYTQSPAYFSGTSTVELIGQDADAGYAVQYRTQLDLETGGLTRLEVVQYEYDVFDGSVQITTTTYDGLR
ncbi:MAG: hypothetical protein AAB490_03790 [Patescibacteria group bacterium]